MLKYQRVISYCISNIDGTTLRRLRGKGYTLLEEHCLQRCGHCYEGPFLLLGEKLLMGQSHKAILDAIEEGREVT